MNFKEYCENILNENINLEKGKYYQYYGKSIKYLGKEDDFHIFREEGIGKIKLNNSQILQQISNPTGELVKIKFQKINDKLLMILANGINIGEIIEDTEAFDDGYSKISYGRIKIYRIEYKLKEFLKSEKYLSSYDKWKKKPSQIDVVEKINKICKENNIDRKFHL